MVNKKEIAKTLYEHVVKDLKKQNIDTEEAKELIKRINTIYKTNFSIKKSSSLY